MQAQQTKKKTTGTLFACFLFALFLLCGAVLSAGDEKAVEADTLLAPTESAFSRADITVVTQSKTYRYQDDILPCPDHLVYEQLARRKVNAELPEKLQTVEKCLSAGASFPDAFAYCFPRFPAFIKGIKQEVDEPAVNSEIHFYPNRRPPFSVTREKYGREIDENRLYQEIYLALKHSATVRVTASVRTVRPEVTLQDNIACTKKIASFSTSFATSGEGRRNNIALALQKINGAVVPAGETFSFNKRVGPRNEKNGFMLAKIIVGGEYTDGIGGGVCQVSTTLYNAALLAGMRVTTVRGHTIQPSYVPPSLDAMVNASSSDLCFYNPFDTPVFIAAFTAGDTAVVTFYGHALPYIVKTYSRETYRGEVPPDREEVDTAHKYFDEDAVSGTRTRVSYGHAKVKSEGYLRYFTPSGQLIKEEKIRSDTYAETKGLIAVAP